MKLFEPITIRKMTLKNRIIMAPMQTSIGYRSKRGIAYYAERARGGAGAVTGGAVPATLMASDAAWGRSGALDSFVGSMSPLLDAVHGHGAKFGFQLVQMNYFPGGLQLDDDTGKPIAPSTMVEPDPPRHIWGKPGRHMSEATVSEIEQIAENFGKAAANVKKAGFDFVIFHGGHGYLAAQFFSPIDNHRNDEYGGDLTRRMRFGVECVKAMRGAVGPDYPIFYRLPADELTPGGTNPNDAAEFGLALERAGVDVLDVTVGDVLGRSLAPPELPMGTYVHLAARVKQRVSVPVAAVGRINKPEIAESILTQGKADLVTIGRQLIADPFWPEKVASGRLSEIVPCLSCNTCEDSATGRQPFHCSVNPDATKEFERAIVNAERPKKVFVLGGGPAGMRAAIEAAGRGHKVTLCEKSERLGGQLLLAACPPFKEPIADFTSYLAREVHRAGVDVKLGQIATERFIARTNPDAVILATGATPAVPGIPGVQGKNVVTALDVLAGCCQVGQNIAIVGGGMIGCETAEFLAARGNEVTILEMLDAVGADVGPSSRPFMLARLKKAGIRIETGAEVKGITDKGVVIAQGGKEKSVEADTVVLAAGMKPNDHLKSQLKGKVAKIYSIGDCAELSKIFGAIEGGARAGREV